MKLHLIDGSIVEIFRQTCGHYIPEKFKETSCNWNINPVELVRYRSSGFFGIGKWGCDGYHDGGAYIRTPEKFEQLIPIDSVVKLTDIGEWENAKFGRPIINDFGTEIGVEA